MTIERSDASTSSRQRHGFPTMDTGAADPSLTTRSIPSARSKLASFAARQPEARVNSFSGAVAGAASGIVTCPLDVIKTKLQAQGGFRPRVKPSTPVGATPSYQGMLGTASIIWRQDGLRGMYRGLGPMLLGYLPTWAVYMTVYGGSRDYYYTKTGELLIQGAYAFFMALC